MTRQLSPAGDPCPPGTIAASALDQVNYACAVLTDQLLHVVVSFDGGIAKEALQSVIPAAIDRCPVLGCRFYAGNRPFWEPVPPDGRAGILNIHASADPARTLRQVLATPIDVSCSPPIRLDLIRSGTDTLCITLHHAAGDARAILDCTRLIAHLYRDPQGAEKKPPVHDCGGMDRDNRRYLSLLPAEAEVPPDSGTIALPAPGVFPFRTGECGARDFALRTLPPEYLDRILAFGKARSATADAVLLAATVLAFRRFGPPVTSGTIPLMHSLDLRRHFPGPGQARGQDQGPCRGQPEYDIANRSVPFAILLPCDDRQTLDSLVIPAAEALRRYRESGGALLEVLKTETMAQEGFTAIREYVANAQESYRRHGCSSPFFVNAGIVPEECFDFGPDLPVTGAFVAAGIATDPPGIVLTAGTFRNRLTLIFGFCSQAISHETATGLLGAIVDALPRPDR